VDEGSRAKRMLIGFGAGAASLQTHVEAYQITSQGPRLLGSGTVTAKGGKMPGMLVPVTVGAAAGSAGKSAAISGGANVIQEIGPEGIGAAASRSASAISDRLKMRFQEQGWL
jgi:hypothetical protein